MSLDLPKLTLCTQIVFKQMLRAKAIDMRYFARRKFFRSLVYKKNFDLR